MRRLNTNGKIETLDFPPSSKIKVDHVSRCSGGGASGRGSRPPALQDRHHTPLCKPAPASWHPPGCPTASFLSLYTLFSSCDSSSWFFLPPSAHIFFTRLYPSARTVLHTSPCSLISCSSTTHCLAALAQPPSVNFVTEVSVSPCPSYLAAGA